MKPGEKLPLDGRVVAGSSDVNQAPITGESRPIAKNAGDQVFAGTINGDGALEVECTKRAEDTTLAHIVRLVGESQSRRAPSEQWVDRFARYYTPLVICLALLVLLLPPLLLGGQWEDWWYRSLFVILTLAGYASLWAAISADVGATLLVIFNGLRLLRVGPSP